MYSNLYIGHWGSLKINPNPSYTPKFPRLLSSSSKTPPGFCSHSKLMLNQLLWIQSQKLHTSFGTFKFPVISSNQNDFCLTPNPHKDLPMPPFLHDFFRPYVCERMCLWIIDLLCSGSIHGTQTSFYGGEGDGVSCKKDEGVGVIMDGFWKEACM